MSTEEKKYLALITFENNTRSWQWLKSHYLDSAWNEMKQIFQHVEQIKDIQFVNADRWRVRHVDKDDSMNYKESKHAIVSYNHENSDEEVVPYALVPVKVLVSLPRDSDYGIMSSANFEICFDTDGQLSMSLARDNEVSYKHLDKIMNLSWWFDEARKRLLNIQENRNELDILVGPNGEECYIKWSDK